MVDWMILLVGVLAGAFVCAIGAAAATSVRVRRIHAAEKKQIIDEAVQAASVRARDIAYKMIPDAPSRPTVNLKPNTPQLPPEERYTIEYDPDPPDRKTEP